MDAGGGMTPPKVAAQGAAAAVGMGAANGNGAVGDRASSRDVRVPEYSTSARKMNRLLRWGRTACSTRWSNTNTRPGLASTSTWRPASDFTDPTATWSPHSRIHGPVDWLKHTTAVSMDRCMSMSRMFAGVRVSSRRNAGPGAGTVRPLAVKKAADPAVAWAAHFCDVSVYMLFSPWAPLPPQLPTGCSRAASSATLLDGSTLRMWSWWAPVF